MRNLNAYCNDLNIGVERNFNSIICSRKFHKRREYDKNNETFSELFDVVKNNDVVSSSNIDKNDHWDGRSARRMKINFPKKTINRKF